MDRQETNPRVAGATTERNYFGGTKLGKKFQDFITEGITRDEFQILKMEMLGDKKTAKEKRFYYVTLHLLLEIPEFATEIEGRKYIKESAKDVMLMLSSYVSPVSQIIPFALLEDLEKMMRGEIVTGWKPRFIRLSPHFYYFWVHYTGGVLSDQEKEIFFRFVKSLMEIVKKNIFVENTDTDVEDLPFFEDEITELDETGCYFPGRPIIRNIRNYEADYKKEEVKQCTKKSKTKGKFGAGLMFWFCLDCPNMVGFYK